jgi:predicted flap endonuclease-1-like 5' DNA nuclease
VIYVAVQIWIWLLIALALGAVIGWLWTRLSLGGRLEDEVGPWRDRVTALERERDQLRRELGEARDRATDTRLGALREEAEPAPPVEEAAEAGEPEPVSHEPRANGAAEPIAEPVVAAEPAPEAEEPVAAEPAVEPPPPLPEPVTTEPAAPRFPPAPADAEPDNLTAIKGIGRALEARLNGLGISTYAQIATLSEDDIRRIDDALGFRGRVLRDRWIQQAQTLVEDRRSNGPG